MHAVRLVKKALAVRRNSRSQVEEDQIAYLEWAASTFGSSIAGAADKDDLEGRIEAIIANSDFHRARLTMASWVIAGIQAHEGAKQSAFGLTENEQADAVQVFRSVLGPAADQALRSGFKYLRAITEVLPFFVQQNAEVAAQIETNTEGLQTAVEAIIYDPEVPPEIARCLLGSFRADAFQLGIIHALLHEQPFPSWLGLAVAEHWAQGWQSYFRLLGSATKGLEISEDILPQDQRLDIDALIARSRQADSAFKSLLANAERSDEPVYPPYL